MAAGNWLTSAGIGDANITVGPRAIHKALNDAEKNRDIIGHPVMQAMLADDFAGGNMSGYLGVSPSFAAIGQGKMAAAAEGSGASATNFSTTNASTITPARREFVRTISDFAQATQGRLLTGEIGPDVQFLVAYESFMVWANDFVDRIVALASSATNVIGTTATALTWQDVMHGAYGFKDRGAANERKLMLVDLKGAKDLADDAISLGGAVSMAAQVQQFMQNGAQGSYIGSFFGGLDIYLNGELDTDSGDTLGIVLGRGGVGSKHQRVPLPPNADQVVDAGVYTVEVMRNTGGTNDYSAVSHNAVGILEQGRLAAVRYVS